MIRYSNDDLRPNVGPPYGLALEAPTHKNREVCPMGTIVRFQDRRKGQHCDTIMAPVTNARGVVHTSRSAERKQV
jgi:hypothetical protein